MSDGTRPRFTFIDIVVLLLLAPFLLAAIGSLGTSRERANRVKCASNLRQIGQGIMIYANDNKDLYPRTPFAPAAALDCTFAGAAAPNPFETGAVPVNNVPASYFLLVRNDLNCEVFICPSTDDVADDLGGQPAGRRSNFSSQKSLSYSFAPPESSVPNTGYKLFTGLNPQFAVAADQNHGGTSGDADLGAPAGPTAPQEMLKKANSLNHLQDGQNVLFADGHVDWCTTPFQGVNQDHIYTSDIKPAPKPPTFAQGPVHLDDSVLLPAFMRKIERPSAFSGAMMVLVGIGVAAGIFAGVWFLARRKPSPIPDAPPPPIIQ